MFELGCISATEWAIYQDWHSLLVEEFGPRVELEGIIYLRAPPEVNKMSHANEIIKRNSLHCAKPDNCLDLQTCLKRLQHRGRAEEEGVKLDYLEMLHVQHERWLVEKSTE